MLFHDLKLAVRTGKTSNLNELKYFCKEHWASTVRRPNVERLIGNYCKWLIAVLAANSGTTSYVEFACVGSL